MRRLNGLVLVFGVMMVGELGAQDARDSTTFRAGQWGTEFAVGSSFSGAGVLRFRSPVRAWLFDAGASLNSSSDEGGDADRENDGAQVEVRLGHRWYRSLAPRVNQYFTMGALGSWARGSQEFGAGNSNEATMTGFGVFGAVGANWMVAPHLSLGAAWQAQAMSSRTRNDITVTPPPGIPCTSPSCQSRRETNRFTSIGFGSASLRLALYY